MSVVIRLARGGRTNMAVYRVTVADSRRRRDGNYLENVGWFNPSAKTDELKLKLDLPAIDKWISNGAQPTDTVRKLIKDFRKANA